MRLDRRRAGFDEANTVLVWRDLRPITTRREVLGPRVLMNHVARPMESGAGTVRSTQFGHQRPNG